MKVKPVCLGRPMSAIPEEGCALPRRAPCGRPGASGTSLCRTAAPHVMPKSTPQNLIWEKSLHRWTCV